MAVSPHVISTVRRLNLQRGEDYFKLVSKIMGWTSYLEDIVNRYNNEFKSVRKRVSKKRKSVKSRSKHKKEKQHLEYEDERAELLGLYIRCKKILSEIKSALELAANSEIDLAEELIEANQAVSHLRLELKKTREEKDLAQRKAQHSLKSLRENYYRQNKQYSAQTKEEEELRKKLAKKNKISSLARNKIEEITVESQRLITENQRLERENQELKNFFSQIRSGTPLKELKPTEKSLEPNKNHQVLIYKSNKQNPKKRNGRY